ncbi:MAG TPA: DUF4446 domain-containing protein [Ruminiclostridium sp.]|nr:DUF4446 domain-containing protein [Ruminiclostridium sp.]
MEEYLIYIGGGLLILCLMLLLIEHIRLSRLVKKYKLLMQGLSEKNVEDLMVSYSDELLNIKDQINGDIESRIKNLENRMPTCLRNFGLVSYNAFENVGNNMSFSLSALDDKKNGFLLTGIYTRENSYLYAKEIISGQSKKELSREEKEALSKALSFTK